MSSTLVIYNPVAGRGRAARLWPQVENELRRAGVSYEVVRTRARFEAMRQAERAAGMYSTVISIGGDGTVHEIVNGLMRASAEGETIALGLVPLGSGDDYIKMMPPETPVGGTSYDWRTALHKLTRPDRQTRLFDVGRIVADHPPEGLPPGPHYFMNGMDIGFGARAVLHTQQVPPFLSGMAMYAAAILRTLVAYYNPRVTIRLDDAPPIEQGTTMTAVMIGRCIGNGFWVAPDARADDGVFDVLIAEAMGRRQILALVPKLMKGTHTHEPILRIARARRVVIDSPDPLAVESDGEVPFLEAQHLEIEILPRRLRVIV